MEAVKVAKDNGRTNVTDLVKKIYASLEGHGVSIVREVTPELQDHLRSSAQVVNVTFTAHFAWFTNAAVERLLTVGFENPAPPNRRNR